MNEVPIRDAATVILLRRSAGGASVLMGQRGSGAAFMPSKFVFPGGAVDPGDAAVPLATPLATTTARDLSFDSGCPPVALAAAAIRELWEEAGLRFASPGAWEGPPRGWRSFAAGGHVPDPSAFRFIFRAITPPGRPRRFDARFFLAEADGLTGDPDDFSAAEDELSHLHWVDLQQTRTLDLPFVTEIVLAEVRALVRGDAGPGIPYYRSREAHAEFLRIG